MIEKPDRYTVSAEPVEFNGRQCTEVTGKDESFLLFDMDSIQAAFEAVAYRSAAYFDAETGDPVKAVFDLSGCYDNPEVLSHIKEITFLGFDTVTEIEIPEQVLAEAVSVSD